MKRILVACLLLASGAAAAQTGIVLTSGPGAGVVLNPIVVEPSAPGPGITYVESYNPSFAVIPYDGVFASFVQNTESSLRAPDPTTMLLGEQPILTIEEDGVRLPEQRLDTVLH